jgi:hypothetical protein
MKFAAAWGIWRRDEQMQETCSDMPRYFIYKKDALKRYLISINIEGSSFLTLLHAPYLYVLIFAPLDFMIVAKSLCVAPCNRFCSGR